MDQPTDGVAVQYIGHRDTYREGAYGSGIVFERGDTRIVPAELARKLLKHPDVYVPGKARKGMKVETVDSVTLAENEAEKTQPERDAVANMDKDALSTYAQTHFRISIDKRKSVDDLRAQVTGLIDQYGITV